MKEVTPESFALFLLVEPRIGTLDHQVLFPGIPLVPSQILDYLTILPELIILGTGSSVEKVDPNIGSFLKGHGISLEVQDTVCLFSNCTECY